MTEVACTKSQEEYEEEFEKDLDWLINEDRIEELGSHYEEIEAETDRKLEKHGQEQGEQKNHLNHSEVADADTEVSGEMSELELSPRDESRNVYQPSSTSQSSDYEEAEIDRELEKHEQEQGEQNNHLSNVYQPSSTSQGSDYEETEAEIDRKLEEHEKKQGEQNNHLSNVYQPSSTSQSSDYEETEAEIDRKLEKHEQEQGEQNNHLSNVYQPSSTSQGSDYEETEAEIDRKLEEHEKKQGEQNNHLNHSEVADADTEVSGEMSELELSPRDESRNVYQPSSTSQGSDYEEIEAEIDTELEKHEEEQGGQNNHLSNVYPPSSTPQGSDYEEIEAEIDRELEEHEQKQEEQKNQERGHKTDQLEKEEEERWPSPMDPLEYDSDRDSSSKSPPVVVAPPPETDDQTEEEKKYILEKIQQANRELQEQEVPDVTRRRRLQFKETLVDLAVSPLQFDSVEKSDEAEGEMGPRESSEVTDADTEVSGEMSALEFSPQDESRIYKRSNSEEDSESKDTKVLVEKDGKFHLVSMNEVESNGILPPIPNSFSDYSHSSPPIQQQAGKTHSSSSSPQLLVGSSSFHLGVNHPQAPRPPAQPRFRSRSANHSQKDSLSRNGKRRVQSATGTPCQSTYSLSSQQKELLQRIQEKKERLAKETEQRKQEEEELKRHENEQAFKNWLMKKREQFQEEKRIQHAQEMERMSSKKDPTDPKEAYQSWLQRKREQQQKERQLVELRKLEEDSNDLLHSREECEHAFKLWLRKKHAMKRAEQQAAREHSRRLALEEREARRMRDMMCTVNEPQPFRFTEQLTYRF